MASKRKCEEQVAMETRKAAAVDIFGGLTVEWAIGQRDLTGKLPLHYTLGDLARALQVSHRSATAVADCDGNLVGLLTENDVMRAFLDGAPPELCLNDWLAGGKVRAPPPVLQKLTVRPSAPLAEVAERMVNNAISGDCACHHVMVKDEDGRLYAVLSACDMVRALCRPEMSEHPVFHVGREGLEPGDPAATVRDVMKLRETVFTCPPTNTMKDVLKVLLMTQQNSALIVDEEGIYGIVTPRDAVQAFADGVPSSVRIGVWLREQPGGVEACLVAADAPLADAAALMTAKGLDHLVVVLSGSMLAVGVLSSLDLVLFTKAHTPLLRSRPLWAGPSVGKVLGQDWHRTTVCKRSDTLGDVARDLATSGRTSATVLGDTEGDSPIGLLTETDLMQAFLDGRLRTSTVGQWLPNPATQQPLIPPQLVVPPAMLLTDAAGLMLSAADPGKTYHHLVVKRLDGQWVGVFSALDVARGLCGLCSDLEVALTFAYDATAGMVMKPLDAVPTCKPGDTIHSALSRLLASDQNAALVVDERGVHGLITPRCALQALAFGIPHDSSVAAWLGHQRLADAPGEVAPGAQLLEAAHVMATHSLHHLLVAKPGEEPVGVLSSLDLARGVASSNCPFPFLSLAWLRLCKGPMSCTVRSPRGSADLAAGAATAVAAGGA